MERRDLSKLPHPVLASVEVSAGAKIEASQVGYGPMDGKTIPTTANVVDIYGTGWTVRIERVRDEDAATAADATRGLNLEPDMVLTSETLPDGGWMLVYKTPDGEHWLKSVHKAAKVVCNSNGPGTKEQVDTVAKICKTIRPAE